MIKAKLAKKFAALGLSATAALSAGYLIIPFEGEVKKDSLHVVYADPGGILTYCWGLTGKDMYGKLPKKGDTYTEDECVVMFAERVRHFERVVERHVKVDFASAYQKAGITSFAFNVGEGNFSSSTHLANLNAGNHDAACEQLLRWKYQNRVVLPGLEKRRAEEKQWCLGNVPYDVKVTFEGLVELIKTFNDPGYVPKVK